MKKLNEVIASLNDENVEEVKEQLISETTAMQKENRKLYARAKKAEGFTYNKETEKYEKNKVKEEVKAEVKQNPTQGYSLGDIRALNKIHDEDIGTVERYAKFRNISVAEALTKSETLKTIIQGKVEKRKTAEASNTGGGQRGNSVASGEELYNKVNSDGQLPEDKDDMDAMIDARMNNKFKRR